MPIYSDVPMNRQMQYLNQFINIHVYAYTHAHTTWILYACTHTRLGVKIFWSKRNTAYYISIRTLIWKCGTGYPEEWHIQKQIIRMMLWGSSQESKRWNVQVIRPMKRIITWRKTSKVLSKKWVKKSWRRWLPKPKYQKQIMMEVCVWEIQVWRTS